MNFGQAISSGFRNYVSFSGRACRSEYWYWYLFWLIAFIVTMVLDRTLFPDSDTPPLNSLWSLAAFLPSIAMGVRRLHDIDRTGWWMLVILTLIGCILLFIWACMKGTTGPNRFGPDPLAGTT